MMSTNVLKQLETKEVSLPDGKARAIFIALDINDKNKADGFIAEVLQKFTMQKMISPPDTAMLLVTIIGEMTAEDFRSRWKKAVAQDMVVGMLLSKFTRADVLWGDEKGKPIDQKSLLE
jgi:hypothetical protein